MSVDGRLRGGARPEQEGGPRLPRRDLAGPTAAICRTCACAKSRQPSMLDYKAMPLEALPYAKTHQHMVRDQARVHITRMDQDLGPVPGVLLLGYDGSMG